MRVVFADHVAHHARRLDRFGTSSQSQFLHGKQHAPLYRLLPVLDVRQRPPFDDGNGVFEVITRSGFVQQNAVALFIQRDGRNKAIRRRRRRHRIERLIEQVRCLGIVHGSGTKCTKSPKTEKASSRRPSSKRASLLPISHSSEHDTRDIATGIHADTRARHGNPTAYGNRRKANHVATGSPKFMALPGCQVVWHWTTPSAGLISALDLVTDHAAYHGSADGPHRRAAGQHGAGNTTDCCTNCRVLFPCIHIRTPGQCHTDHHHGKQAASEIRAGFHIFHFHIKQAPKVETKCHHPLSSNCRSIFENHKGNSGLAIAPAEAWKLCVATTRHRPIKTNSHLI